MVEVLFRTTDYLHFGRNNKYLSKYYKDQAIKSGLEILEFDDYHIQMLGDKKSFFKYYSRCIPISVKYGVKLSKELRRTISVLLWK